MFGAPIVDCDNGSSVDAMQHWQELFSSNIQGSFSPNLSPTLVDSPSCKDDNDFETQNIDRTHTQVARRSERSESQTCEASKFLQNSVARVPNA